MYKQWQHLSSAEQEACLGDEASKRAFWYQMRSIVREQMQRHSIEEKVGFRAGYAPAAVEVGVVEPEPCTVQYL